MSSGQLIALPPRPFGPESPPQVSPNRWLQAPDVHSLHHASGISFPTSLAEVPSLPDPLCLRGRAHCSLSAASALSAAQEQPWGPDPLACSTAAHSSSSRDPPTPGHRGPSTVTALPNGLRPGSICCLGSLRLPTAPYRPACPCRGWKKDALHGVPRTTRDLRLEVGGGGEDAQSPVKHEVRVRGTLRIPSRHLLNVSGALGDISRSTLCPQLRSLNMGRSLFEPKETPLECILKNWKLFFSFTVTVSGLYLNWWIGVRGGGKRLKLGIFIDTGKWAAVPICPGLYSILIIFLLCASCNQKNPLNFLKNPL